MYQYYNDVLNNTTLHQPLNEYELTMVLDLLRKGHAKAEEKTHGGVKFISVGVHSEWKSRCFMVHHEDGSKIDFSYRKYVPCLAPEESCLAVQCSAVHACMPRCRGRRRWAVSRGSSEAGSAWHACSGAERCNAHVLLPRP